MENKKKHSSIPSNYVTLVQLQERWIKEQQRKQAEKEQQRKQAEKEQQRKQAEKEQQEREEQEKREREEREQREREEQEQREREEQERRLEEEKKLREKVCDLKQTGKEETSQTNSKSIIRQKPYCHRNFKANRPNSDEPHDKAEALTVIAIDKETRDEGLKNDDQEKKKKRKNKWKPKREEEVIGETEYGGTAEPETKKEVFKYFPARRGAWGNGIRGELRWKRKNPVANGKVSDSDDHVVVEVEQKFEDLLINNEDSSAHVSINEVSEKDEDYVVVEMNGEEKFENLSINRGNEEGKSRSRVAMNGPRGWYRGSQRFCRGGWGDWNRPGGWGSWNRPRGGGAWNRHRGGRAWNRPRENGSWTWVRKGEGFDGDVRAQPN